MSKLVTLNRNKTLEGKLSVQVATTADPRASVLLAARELIRQNEEVKAAFNDTGVDREALYNALVNILDEPIEDLQEVTNYLADERTSLGEAVLLISPETGKAIAKLKSEDMYVPAPVAREDGTLVVRGPEIRPEIYSAIIQHYHDQSRDAGLQETMLAKIPNRSFLPAALLERKTLFVTQGGRRQVASLVHDALPTAIDASKGVVKSLFDFFPRVSSVPSDSTSFAWSATVTRGVMDPTTQNLRFDVIQSTLSAVAGVWARQLALHILQEGAKKCVTFDGTNLPRGAFYLTTPSTLSRVSERQLVVDLKSNIIACLTGGVIGNLAVEDYHTEVREVHDKWTLCATLKGSIYVNWEEIRFFQMEELDEYLPVEIVS